MNRYDHYKASGIDWIGEIPEHWEVKKGKRIIAFTSGFPFDANKFENDAEKGFPLVRIRNIMTSQTDTFFSGDIIENAIIDDGDILVGMDGDFNSAIWRGGKALLNQRVLKVNGKEEFDDKYLFYCLPTALKIINDLTYFTTVKHLSNDDLKREDFPFPPLAEQVAIAEYLDRQTAEIDATLARKEAMLKKLGDLRAARIHEVVTRGLHPNAPLKPSGVEWIGDIPEHWEVRKLKQLTTKIGSGVTPKGGAEVYVDEGIPLIRSQNVYNDGLRLKEVANIELATHNEMAGTHLMKDDVLLNITGASIGRAAVYDGCFEQANVNQHVCIIRCESSKLLPNFLHMNLIGPSGQAQLVSLQTGGNRDGLTNGQLKEFVLPLPPLAEQAVIADYLDAFTQKTDALRGQLKVQMEALRQYRQSLITEVVTGKLRVA